MLKKLTLRQIEVFVLAAKKGSFGDAAEGLGITQPALSQAVRDLELDYGTQLFDRSTRPVRLTPVGQQFLPIAERVVNAYHAARKDLESLAAGREGRVTIAAVQSFASGFMPKVLAEFSKKYPRIVVEIIEDLAARVAHHVHTAVADFGVANLIDTPVNLITEPLLQDSYNAICPGNHPLAAKAKVTWSELAQYPLVGMIGGASVWREMEAAIQQTGVPYQVNYWASNPVTVIAMVGAGLGVCSMPGLVRQNLESLNLVARPLVEPSVKRVLTIITRRGETPGPAASLVMDHLARSAKAAADEGFRATSTSLT